MTANPRIGFIGLGFMGHGMAHNLLAKGFPLTVMAHRKREAVNDLAGKGAVEVTSAKELAGRSDVVILCVTGAEQVDDLLHGRMVLRQALATGSSSSTALHRPRPRFRRSPAIIPPSPSSTHRLAARRKRHGLVSFP